MAKTSTVERNKKRRRMVKSAAPKRAKLKAIIMDRDTPDEERYAAVVKLSQVPRNSSKVRIRNRCELTGRPRATYRKFKMARNKLREYASKGMIPGMVKSSW
ncbi:MAG: 30S ribosomal protein S14 [Rhodospirillaceae bacterium]|jgi:small subunit ribosomal protein S14|nr:30S ribosomal protein S14 [Rhodospirillaceae bacterium]